MSVWVLVCVDGWMCPSRVTLGGTIATTVFAQSLSNFICPFDYTAVAVSGKVGP